MGNLFRYSLCVEFLTSSRKTDRRGARAQFHRAFKSEVETNREDFGSESTRLILNQAATAPFLFFLRSGRESARSLGAEGGRLSFRTHRALAIE
jgi:hypothetical protein